MSRHRRQSHGGLRLCFVSHASGRAVESTGRATVRRASRWLGGRTSTLGLGSRLRGASAVTLQNMGATVARLTAGSPDDGGGGLPPADLYRIAVEEYRFQAQFNWSRTQYLLAFNAAVLAAAIGLAAQQGRLAAIVFGLGLVAAVLSDLVVRVQHGYYRVARDHMRRIEKELNISRARRLDTTSKLGERPRTISVNTVVHLLLIAVATANALGIALVLLRH